MVLLRVTPDGYVQCCSPSAWKAGRASQTVFVQAPVTRAAAPWVALGRQVYGLPLPRRLREGPGAHVWQQTTF